MRALNSAHGQITHQSSFKLNVDCHMEPDTTVQILYVARSRVNGTITGTGRFNGTMAFYTSRSFAQVVGGVMKSAALFVHTCTVEKQEQYISMYLHTKYSYTLYMQ